MAALLQKHPHFDGGHVTAPAGALGQAVIMKTMLLELTVDEIKMLSVHAYQQARIKQATIDAFSPEFPGPILGDYKKDVELLMEKSKLYSKLWRQLEKG